MLLPTARDLRRALTRYAEAVIEDERFPTTATAREREDRAYTLCVMTGAAEVAGALHAADALLERRGARVRRATRLPGGPPLETVLPLETVRGGRVGTPKDVPPMVTRTPASAHRVNDAA
ncbi:DUF5133 domain-containing protein [Streptomyces sp. NPDC102467]|uniref:DUF5133 domain-containing protein n=1 Tax=Streptomyces sp. NPDC102467 TaxID=3366179 RepID=UPI003820EFE8